MPVDLEELEDVAATLDWMNGADRAKLIREAITELSALRAAQVGADVRAGKSIETRAADALDAVYEETMSKHVNLASCREARRAIIAQAIRDALADVGAHVGAGADLPKVPA